MNKKFEAFSEILRNLVKSIHTELGPGFTESVYQGALAIELRRCDINYLKEMNFEIFYKQQVAGEGRLDFFINDKKIPNLIIETKSLSCLNDSSRSQITSYLLSAQFNSDAELRKTKFGVLINWPGAIINGNNSQLINKEPEVEFYELKNGTVTLIDGEQS